jgi:Sugar (and other) transporter
MEQERKQAMEKQESKKALSNFSTASTATDYNQLRGTDSEGKVSLGSFTHWLMTAILSWIFPLLSAHSSAVPFAFFSLMMAAQFFVVLAIFPETKGISLEEMQRKLGIN